MTTPTSNHDDPLAVLLRDTFTAHEPLADPDRAVELARTPHGRRRPVAALLVGVAAAASIAVGTAFVVSNGELDQVTDPATTSSPTTSMSADEQAVKAAQDAKNQAEAAALAVSLLDDVPVLPGATRYDEAPVPELAKEGLGVGGQLLDQRGTTWWLAPGSTDDAQEFFVSHRPEGFQTEDGGPGWSSDESGVKAWFLIYQASTTSPGVLGPELVVQWAAVDGGVVVRADTWVGWRPTRLGSSYLNDSATSATIVTIRNQQEIGRQEVDGEALARLSAAYDGLLGVAFGLHSCPAMIDRVDHRIVFHTPTGDLTVSDAVGCDPGLEVRQDGKVLDPLLLETDDFRNLLTALAPVPD